MLIWHKLIHSVTTAEERYLAFCPSSMAAAAIFMVSASFCSDAGLEAMQDYLRDLNIEVCSLKLTTCCRVSQCAI